jgi:hypothetical protein
LLTGRDGSSAVHDRRRRAALVLAVAAAAVAACMAVVPGASAAPARPAGGAQRLATANPWGKAQEVPGTAALNKGGNAEITSVSCASAGNCSAGGSYAGEDLAGASQAFVVSEVHGRWRKAEEVPGTAALNKGDVAEITSVSCASAGNCSAGGSYADAGCGCSEAFVVSEVHGTWRKAEEVPGTAALNTGESAEILSVSCASAGNCTAGGYYRSGYFQDGTPISQAFVVSEAHGTWRKAEEVPGTAALNTGESAEILSVSCASAGNCGAGGYYTGVGIGQEAFVVSEVHGTWRKAEEVPGTAALNKDEFAVIGSVSCASAGNCTAGGAYADGHVSQQAFVVSEVHGTWRKAEEVPGTAALNKGDVAEINSVSCASAGNCSAGGGYARLGHEAFVVSEAHRSWRRAEEVPGIAALNKGRQAETTSVSCASAGNCSAGGYYLDGSHVTQAFVVSEVHGIWRRAEEVPGTAALNNKGNGNYHVAEITSVSCGSAGHCSAGGDYLVNSGTEAFVVSRK